MPKLNIDKAVVWHNSAPKRGPLSSRNIDVLIVRGGSVEITLSGEVHSLYADTVAVFDVGVGCILNSFSDGADFLVVSIPPEMAVAFSSLRGTGKIEEPVIQSPKLVATLAEVAEKYLSTDSRVMSAGAELFLAMLVGELSFTDTSRGELPLVRKILDFIDREYRSDISRESIADALGCTVAYISRAFNRHIGIGLNEYIYI